MSISTVAVFIAKKKKKKEEIVETKKGGANYEPVPLLANSLGVATY